MFPLDVLSFLYLWLFSVRIKRLNSLTIKSHESPFLIAVQLILLFGGINKSKTHWNER